MAIHITYTYIELRVGKWLHKASRNYPTHKYICGGANDFAAQSDDRENKTEHEQI